ncbi:MAG: metalloregulator ArsR/SmtB family transcription factor [Eubacterium sp.]|nr:metalloregulator ArsR/SmtB family transcription factor [Eubacterium sp.]
MADKKYECSCEVIHEEVVGEVQKNMDSERNYQDLATLFKMFGDPTRVKILHALRLHEMCVCDLAALLGVTKSAISHQLKSLRLSNLVQNRREGQVVYYSLADAHVEMILDLGMEHINE